MFFQPLLVSEDLFSLFSFNESHIIMQGLHPPSMAFTGCHSQGSNLLPPDMRASTVTIQPIQFAYFLYLVHWLRHIYWLCLKHLLFKKYGVPQSLLQHCWDGAKLYLGAYLKIGFLSLWKLNILDQFFSFFSTLVTSFFVPLMCILKK